MRLTAKLLALFLLAASTSRSAAAADDPSAQSLQSRGDSLRREEDLAGAIAAYENAIAAGGPKVEILSDIGNCYEGLRRNRDAAAAYHKALAIAPDDPVARQDLDDLRRRRGLILKTVLGGDEPGTSKQAFDAQARYGGVDGLDLMAGYGYSDQVYYSSNKGFASVYWFYQRDSYLKADFTLRRYSYPSDPTLLRPNPDLNAYDWVPRGDVEIAHWFGRRFRGGIDYQLFVPNFFYDSSVRATNHKLSGEGYWITPFQPLRLSLFVALLRDPDPSSTTIRGRAGATVTQVVYRTTSLVGGAAALEAGRWNVEARIVPNRELDNSYAWSLLSTVGFEATSALGFKLQHIYDIHSSVSSFNGSYANVLMGQARYALPFGLLLGAGLKYVNAPTRAGFTVLAWLEYRTGIW